MSVTWVKVVTGRRNYKLVETFTINDCERKSVICIYKITKIVRALWLAERSVCIRVCKHGCGVKLFGFSRANHASTNLKKFSSSKLDRFTLLTHYFKRTKHCWPTTLNILWMLHVASVCTPCCMLLCVVGSCCTKFETDQTFSYVQTDATTPNKLGQQCWELLRLFSSLAEGTNNWYK